MSASPSRCLILFVSDTRDASLRDAIAVLDQAGASVEIVPDVYTAMARLARPDHATRVLVDVRGLDDAETAFLRLAPQYHPNTAVEVPVLQGTIARLAGLGAAVRTVSVAAIAAAIREESAGPARPAPAAPAMTPRATPTAAPAAPVEDAGPFGKIHESAPPRLETGPRRPLSTDGGPETVNRGPSLYEAVRMRMGGSAPARRIPPGAAEPPRTAAREPGAAIPTPALTPEELEALLEAETFREPIEPRTDHDEEIA